MRIKWEYKTLKIPTDSGFFSGIDFDSDRLSKLLNGNGADGWELVSVFDIESMNQGSKFVLAVLKRPVG